jgi:hypothetical protein
VVAATRLAIQRLLLKVSKVLQEFARSGAIRYNIGMTCKHLHDLYELCQTHRLKLSSSDLIRIVCPQCGVEEVCPSVLAEEYETRHHNEPTLPPAQDRPSATEG